MVSSLKIIEIAEIKNAEIRSAQGIDGETVYSVFDLIRAFGGQTNPRKTWNKIGESHDEVVSKSYNLKFPGSGQRTTPVANSRVCMEIAILIPGKKAAKLRALMVDVFVRYFEADPEIAKSVINRTEEPKAIASILEASQAKAKEIFAWHDGVMPLVDLTPSERAAVRPYIVDRQRKLIMDCYESKQTSLKMSVLRKRMTKARAAELLDNYAKSLDKDFQVWLSNGKLEPEPLMLEDH